MAGVTAGASSLVLYTACLPCTTFPRLGSAILLRTPASAGQAFRVVLRGINVLSIDKIVHMMLPHLTLNQEKGQGEEALRHEQEAHSTVSARRQYPT